MSKVGQIIGLPDGFISSPIHSSVSGTVKKTEIITMAGAARTSAAVIETDGLQELCEDVKPPVVTDFESFIEAVKNSGVVGLGGAGFPTFVKLNIKDLSAVDTVIINAADVSRT